MTESPPSAPDTSGHRARLRARFLSGDPSAMNEVGLVELLLTYAIPRRDVRLLAETLIAQFGSVAALLSAEPKALQKVRGINEGTAVLFKLVQALAQDEPQLSEADEKRPLPPPTSEDQPLLAPPFADPMVAHVTETVAENAAGASVSSALHEDAAPAAKPPAVGKLQVSNGYSLDPAQIARLLTYIQEHPTVRKFARRDLMEGTGLAEGQIESLTSIAVGMRLITPLTGLLTPFGRLLCQQDLFMEAIQTLEVCHFLGAGNPRNLIWHEVFNELLLQRKSLDQAGWSAWLRQKLSGQYSKHSLMKHVAAEVRFVLDAYTVRSLRKLNLIERQPDQTLAIRRCTTLQQPSLAAMIYWMGDQHNARLVSFEEIQAAPGSPGRLFGLDAPSLKQMIELLHQKGWLRYEVRHGLDQVRLIDGFNALEFLAAGYEGRDPELVSHSTPPPNQPLLL